MAPKPASKAAKDFNGQTKTYLYSVGAAPKKKPGKKTPAQDFSAAADAMMDKIRALAAREGVAKQVQLTKDSGSLGKLGIFFMNAPEKFAAIVRKTDGVHYVEKSGSTAGVKKSIPSGLRRSGKK